MTKHPIGKSLRTARKQAGLSLTDLAHKSGLSRGYIHLIENDSSSPTSDALVALARALYTSVGALIGEDDASDFVDVFRAMHEDDQQALVDYAAYLEWRRQSKFGKSEFADEKEVNHE
jgi:XRE family transcriptional regulator of biofilm formation